MKRLMCGIAIGLTLGVACSANATNFYYTAADLLSTSTMTQRGYVMGMRDTLAALATNDEAQSAAEDTMRCMDRFENAEALRLWAVRRLNAEADPDRNAAVDTLMVYNIMLSSVAQTTYAEFPPVKFLEVRSPVPHGGQGLVTIQTNPRTPCGITVLYKSGPSRAAGLAPQTANPQGTITWGWKVGTRTTPGTWPIIVKCGTNDITRIRTTFDVT